MMTLKAFLLLHEESLAEFGGARGLRDEGLLDSALARPQNAHAYNDGTTFAELAASYGFGIAKTTPFWMETSALLSWRSVCSLRSMGTGLLRARRCRRHYARGCQRERQRTGPGDLERCKRRGSMRRQPTTGLIKKLECSRASQFEKR